MRVFTAYKPNRYTTNKRYLRYDYGDSCNKLCKTCGYPWGSHMEENCPTSDESWIKNVGLKPEFYRLLNSKIKVV